MDNDANWLFMLFISWIFLLVLLFLLDRFQKHFPTVWIWFSNLLVLTFSATVIGFVSPLVFVLFESPDESGAYSNAAAARFAIIVGGVTLAVLVALFPPWRQHLPDRGGSWHGFGGGGWSSGGGFGGFGGGSFGGGGASGKW